MGEQAEIAALGSWLRVLDFGSSLAQSWRGTGNIRSHISRGSLLFHHLG